MYTNNQTVKDYLQITNWTYANTATLITTWISAVKNYIDDYCGRTFEQETATTKLYNGTGKNELIVDDVITVTKIEFLDDDGNADETFSVSTDWYLYPENKNPKTIIKMNVSNAGSIFPKGLLNIKITGTFGYASSVPEQIKLVATKLVADIVMEYEEQGGSSIASESLGEYSVSYSKIYESAEEMGIKSILNMYRRIAI